MSAAVIAARGGFPCASEDVWHTKDGTRVVGQVT